MSSNCHVIVIFLVSGQFGTIRKPDSGCIVFKTYIFINSNLFLQKLKTELKISDTAIITIAEQRYYFCQKMLMFC